MRRGSGRSLGGRADHAAVTVQVKLGKDLLRLHSPQAGAGAGAGAGLRRERHRGAGAVPHTGG
eukprot:SAG11_NODE_443_length_9422_cov_4.441382_1_plen_63_part_00